MIQAAGNKEYLTVNVTHSTDIIDRLLNAVAIFENKGIKVIRAVCSKKLFHDIAVKTAPKVGYVEKRQFLIGGKKPTNKDTEIDGGVLLEPHENMIYNKKKPFVLFIERNGKTGTTIPEYPTNTTVKGFI